MTTERRRILIKVFCLLNIFGLGSCKVPIQDGSAEKLFVFEKTACFGKCPIYTLTFFANGIVEMDGKAFVDKLGIFELQLTNVEYKDILKSLNELDFCALKPIYGEGVADLPSTIIRYNCQGEAKTVKAIMDYPEKLALFAMNIEGLTKRQNWIAKGGNETSN